MEDLEEPCLSDKPKPNFIGHFLILFFIFRKKGEAIYNNMKNQTNHSNILKAGASAALAAAGFIPRA